MAVDFVGILVSVFSLNRHHVPYFDVVFVMRMTTGDPTGGMRRALAAFPDQDMVARIMDKYFIEGGKAMDKPFRSLPMWTINPPQNLLEATVLANFCEVWLAKHNDDSSPIPGAMVGINRLTKVQLPTIASLYGAILADVDYVLMGAGIPLRIPGVLDALTAGREATFPIDVTGADEPMNIRFDPQEFWTAAGKPDMLQQLHLERPKFCPIVSSVVLAQSMLKRADGQGPTHGIDGFVVELPTAGGHNAPPRGFRYDSVKKSHAVDLNEKGEPVYGPKDEVDLEQFAKATKGLPFWMAGSFAHPDKFCEVLDLGAAGIQAGTIFALSQESGMHAHTKEELLKRVASGDLTVFTDPAASPTGFPFKVVEMDDTLSDQSVYEARPRLCSMGYLRTPYVIEDAADSSSSSKSIGYRCAAEPIDDWVKKGGDLAATQGRKCLCNALAADCGFPQTRKYKDDATGETRQYTELPLVTLGDDVDCVRELMQQDQTTGAWNYSAAEALQFLKAKWEESTAKKMVQEEIKSALESSSSTPKVTAKTVAEV